MTKVYVAKDWTGVHVFAEPPKLTRCGGLPDIWCGHRIKILNDYKFQDTYFPKGRYLEMNYLGILMYIDEHDSNS